MATGVRSLYHIAINSKGFMLRGAPSQPRYIKETAPALANQVGAGDLSYASLAGSGWSYWTQTDWSGGFQQETWKDDATFKDGQAIDVLSEYGVTTLQNGWSSAFVRTSGGGKSYVYGAHNIHFNKLLIGLHNSISSRIISLTSANVSAAVETRNQTSSINSMTTFKNATIIGYTRTSAASSAVATIVRYAGGIIGSSESIRTTNPKVHSVKGMGLRLYSGEYVNSLSGDILYYSTNLSTFTSAYQAGKGSIIKKIEELQGIPYFFVENGKQVHMFRYNELTEKPYPVYTWNNLTDWGIKNYLSYLVITGKSNSRAVAFSFNGTTLKQIFEDRLSDSTYDFSKPFEFQNNLQVKGATWDATAWVPGVYGKFDATRTWTPFEGFANTVYGFVTSGSKIYIGYRDTTKYAISGHIISSEFGSNIGGIDKLVNSVNINMDALATGQTIEVYRSIDGGSTFTSVGTAKFATDGAIKKKQFYIASGLVTKLWNYKTQFVGPGTSTPTLNDITFEYRLAPDLKKRWSLSLDAGDEVMLLNKQREQRDGKSLISDLWLEKEAKRTVVYEDIDAFSVNFVSAMTSANTSARVNNTQYMPRKGRMRVLQNGTIEEMTYTSADTGVVKGITRAQKGTVARAYTSTDTIDNFYNVFVTDVREQVNNTDQNKTESIAQITLLEI